MKALRVFVPHLGPQTRIAIKSAHALTVLPHDGVAVPAQASCLSEAVVEVSARGGAPVPADLLDITHGDSSVTIAARATPTTVGEHDVVVRVPVAADVTVSQLGEGSGLQIRLENLHGSADVSTGTASVALDKMNCSRLRVHTTAGDIIGKAIQGTVDMRADAGSITCNKIQSDRVSLHAPNGELRVRALYGDARIQARAATIGTLQGTVAAETANELFVGSFTGTLRATAKHAFVGLVQPHTASVRAGSVEFGVDSNAKYSVDQTASKTSFTSGESLAVAIATVAKLCPQSWLQATTRIAARFAAGP
eukprot:m.257927 g.257927  ORF g.257927 m.257927 type:complete len:308 (+) comp21157_c0_seq1:33-956(+)